MIDVLAWSLPATAYRPGVNARPADDAALYDMVALAPAVTDPDGWRDNVPYCLGFRLYAHGFFWEAHELWEPVWMRARPNSRERSLLQGLIQSANADLKAALDRQRAARRLFGLAATHFRDATIDAVTTLMGLNPAACAAIAASRAVAHPTTMSSLNLQYNA